MAALLTHEPVVLVPGDQLHYRLELSFEEPARAASTYAGDEDAGDEVTSGLYDPTFDEAEDTFNETDCDLCGARAGRPCKPGCANAPE